MAITAYLITHVATEQQRDKDAAQWALSATGQAQAHVLAKAPFWGTVEQVIVSAEPKTILTVAEVVARRKLPVWVDSRLDELRRLGWAQDYGQKVAQAFAQPEVSIAGWEPAAAALARVRSAVDDLGRRFDGKTVAIVGHGLTISLLRAQLLGYAQVRLEDWARLGFGAVAIVELPAGPIVQDFPLETVAARG